MLGYLFKKKLADPVAAIEPAEALAPTVSVAGLAHQFQRDTSGLGLEAARLRGMLEDSSAVATRQAVALTSLLTRWDRSCLLRTPSRATRMPA